MKIKNNILNVLGEMMKITNNYLIILIIFVRIVNLMYVKSLF